MSAGRFMRRTGVIAILTGVAAMGAGAGLNHAAQQAGYSDPSFAGNPGHGDYVAASTLKSTGGDLAFVGLLIGAAGVAAGAEQKKQREQAAEKEGPDLV